MDFLKGGFNSLKNEESNLYATKMSTKQSLTFYILTYGTSHMTDQWTLVRARQLKLFVEENIL